MKHTKTIIFVLFIILIGMIAIYFSDSEDTTNATNSETRRTQATTKQTSIEQRGEIKSALEEKIEPHAGYYLEEIYVETNQLIEKDTNILKYTNGEYLVAPYDCYITELQLPEAGKKCLNSHYIQIKSSKVLAITMNVSEEKLNQINVGTQATVEVSAVEKEYTGYVTNISSTANNGKFEVKIEFENDGNIKLGMTGKITI